MSFFDLEYLYLFFLILGVFGIVQILKKKNHLDRFSPQMFQNIFFVQQHKILNRTLLILGFLFLVIALMRPIIKNTPITLQEEKISFVIAFDISKSMLAKDVKPNRLEFAQKKFSYLLTKLKDEKVGIIGFSNISYLIAPITKDHNSLQYLVDNLDTKIVDTRGSNIFSALQATNKLLNNEKKKVLLLFTDGTEQNEYIKEIAYAKQNNIKVFIYNIATLDGSSIEDSNGVVFDKKKNIVISKLNDSCTNLALYSDGGYLEYSNNPNDIDRLLGVIRSKFDKKDTQDLVIENNRELFQIPLFLGIVLLFVALYRPKGRA